MDTPTEARRLLSELAAQAPNIDVADQVLQHAARRRRRRTASVVILAITGLAVVPVAADRAQTGALFAGFSGATAPAAGWRWESYDGVRVQVPDSWGEGTTGSQWCANDGPYVGRPGANVTSLCDPPDPPPGKRYSYVWFGPEPDRQDTAEGWTSDTVALPGIDTTVTVFTDDPTIREYVLSTVEPD